MRTHKELQQYSTFKDRFEYLKLGGRVGDETFGFERYLNQTFYKSPEWRKVRNEVILRDRGCDLGLEGHEIVGRVYIHHMNPIDTRDIVNRADILLNPEYLVCVSFETHQAIHYGDYSSIEVVNVERKPNDTCPWKG